MNQSDTTKLNDLNFKMNQKNQISDKFVDTKEVFMKHERNHNGMYCTSTRVTKKKLS